MPSMVLNMLYELNNLRKKKKKKKGINNLILTIPLTRQVLLLLLFCRREMKLGNLPKVAQLCLLDELAPLSLGNSHLGPW